MTKTVSLTFYADQIAYDLLSNCYMIKNLLSEGMTEELKASLDSPDSDETKALICRAVTEAWGRVKYLCQRYLKTGRTTDTNVLERLSYTDEETSALKWEQLKLTLYIPNFNTGVTDILKSTIHKYVTDYTTYRFLQNIVPEKAAEYKTLCDGDDGGADQIVTYLNAREIFTRRRPSFF